MTLDSTAMCMTAGQRTKHKGTTDNGIDITIRTWLVYY